MPDTHINCEDFAKIDINTKIMLNKVTSLQRHDFMNMLQIITGYMQIEDYESAIKKALKYGQIIESTGRLQKHGLAITCLLIDHYIKLYSNFERKIEIVNSLPPTDQKIKSEKVAAIGLLNEILDRYLKEPIEIIKIDFVYTDKIIIRVMMPECEEVEIMDLILKYKYEIPDIVTGLVKDEFFWEYIEFGLFD